MMPFKKIVSLLQSPAQKTTSAPTPPQRLASTPPIQPASPAPQLAANAPIPLTTPATPSSRVNPTSPRVVTPPSTSRRHLAFHTVHSKISTVHSTPSPRVEKPKVPMAQQILNLLRNNSINKPQRQ